jgi:hypothetical protein
LSWRENLWIGGTALGGEEAEPDLCYRGLTAPELEELIEVSGAVGDLRCDSAMDGDLGVLDVFEDALVSGGLATFIVLGLKAIDGDDYVEFLESLPPGRNDSEGAGDDLSVDTASIDLR